MEDGVCLLGQVDTIAIDKHRLTIFHKVVWALTATGVCISCMLQPIVRLETQRRC